MTTDKDKGPSFETILQPELVMKDVKAIVKRKSSEAIQLIILRNAYLNMQIICKSLELLPTSRELVTVLDRMKILRKLLRIIKVKPII